MKIQVMSDLHLEFDAFFLPQKTDADVLVLAGDICVAERFTRSGNSPYASDTDMWMKFFAYCSDNYKKVIYIPGNHEHYHGYFEDTLNILQQKIEVYDNIMVADRDVFVIDGVLFICGTLWTDINKGNPLSVAAVTDRLNDYRVVKPNRYNYRMTAEYTMNEHTMTRDFIKESLNFAEPYDKVVVVTHHAPSEKSVHPSYKGDILNAGYFSNLEDLVADPKINVWIHGHTHFSFDYMLGDTRVVCNPKGYRNENKEFDSKKVIEI